MGVGWGVRLCSVCEEAVRRARTAAARRAVPWDEVEGGAENVGGRCPGGEVWGRGVSEAEVCRGPAAGCKGAAECEALQGRWR